MQELTITSQCTNIDNSTHARADVHIVLVPLSSLGNDMFIIPFH